MSEIQVTIRGTDARQVRPTGRVPFSAVTLSSGGQKSHVIPQATFKAHSDLFDEIGKGTFPDGQLPFDPNNWLDNGQPLPSNNADANGKAIIDAAQHSGSHPVINNMADERLDAIYNQYLADIAGVNDPDVINDARLAAKLRAQELRQRRRTACSK